MGLSALLEDKIVSSAAWCQVQSQAGIQRPVALQRIERQVFVAHNQQAGQRLAHGFHHLVDHPPQQGALPNDVGGES